MGWKCLDSCSKRRCHGHRIVDGCRDGVTSRFRENRLVGGKPRCCRLEVWDKSRYDVRCSRAHREMRMLWSGLCLYTLKFVRHSVFNSG